MDNDLFMQLKNVRLVVSDFDGVMTDNRVLVDEMGQEAVFVSRADGQAVHMLHSIGINLVIMSSETNGVVARRAEKLKVECIQSVSDKKKCLEEYCCKENIPLSNVAYVGNDVNDFAVMCCAGIKIVPADAYDVVKKIADYVTITKGGYGVIREIAEVMQRVKKEKR